jgi:putative acetyltransferase
VDVQIVTFLPIHAPAFATLNRAWLVENALLEHTDEEVLADPVGRIIAPGGQIFLAQSAHEVVGTCAIVPAEAYTFELAKLTVAPVARGRGIGRRLVEACLGFARERHGKRVVLFSNSRLAPALRLYVTLGFRHCPLPSVVKYVQADVHMEYVFATTAA